MKLHFSPNNGTTDGNGTVCLTLLESNVQDTGKWVVTLMTIEVMTLLPGVQWLKLLRIRIFQLLSSSSLEKRARYRSTLYNWLFLPFTFILIKNNFVHLSRQTSSLPGCPLITIISLSSLYLVPNLKQELELSPEEFNSKYGRNKSLENEIIFHCHAGRRADNASSVAKGLGFTKLVYYGLMLTNILKVFVFALCFSSKSYQGSWTEWAAKEGL